jgi:nickel transport protein
MNKSIITCCLLMVCITKSVLAHGVVIEPKMQFPSVVVKSSYSQTELVIGALVTIYAPGDEQPWQTGRTDKTGVFAFVPDKEGTWTFQVDDQQGHIERSSIIVSKEFFAGRNETIVSSHLGSGVTWALLPMFYKTIIGLSIIFGVTGIFYGYRSKQSNQSKQLSD